MESQRDLPYYTGIMTGDIIIDSQLLGTSQNNPMSVSNSPPQFENVSSMKGKRGTNFSVEEGQVKYRYDSILMLMPYTVMNKHIIHFVKKFGNTSRNTIHPISHILLSL